MSNDETILLEAIRKISRFKALIRLVPSYALSTELAAVTGLMIGPEMNAVAARLVEQGFIRTGRTINHEYYELVDQPNYTDIMNAFEKSIKDYLDRKAAMDPAFGEKYNNPDRGKTIEGCCKYIICEVQKTKRQGFADVEIFGMAIHYFDEASVATPAKAPDCRVVVNKEVALSEADKEKLKAEAEEAYKRQEMERLRKAEADRKQREAERARKLAEKKAEERRLQEERERQDGVLFFDFGE